MGIPRPLFVYCRLFYKQTVQFKNKLMWKSPSSKRWWDSNPQPSEHESAPVTTRPGLMSFVFELLVSTNSFVGVIPVRCSNCALTLQLSIFMFACKRRSHLIFNLSLLEPQLSSDSYLKLQRSGSDRIIVS